MSGGRIGSSRTEQDIKEDLEATEKNLASHQAVAKKLQEEFEDLSSKRTSKLNELEIEQTTVEELQTFVQRLKIDLNALTQVAQIEKDFEGCPHEWQKKVIRFMRQHSVPLTILNLVTEAKEAFEGEFKITKAKSDMVSLMSHLIVGKKVEKVKTGVYKWAVLPGNWLKPVTPGAPVQPFPPRVEAPQTQQDPRELLAFEIFNIVMSRQGMQQLKDIEPMFRSLCNAKGLGDDHKAHSLYIEAYLYKRAWPPVGELIIYKLKESLRAAPDLSEHLIQARGRWPEPDSSEWEVVNTPTVRQPAIDTKRKGGSKG